MPDEPTIPVAQSVARSVTPSVTPAPTDDEVVAILAAVEALWPRPVVTADSARPRNTSWRFSGRWWSLPLPMRRDRPFR